MENDYFYGIELDGSTHGTDYNFGERGLKANLISKIYYLASPASASGGTSAMNIARGWSRFTAKDTGLVTASVLNSDDASIEIYGEGMLPVGLNVQPSFVAAELEAEQDYLVFIDGETAANDLEFHVQMHQQLDRSGVYTNPRNNLDVNDDEHVTPADALHLINDLNSKGPRSVSGPATDGPFLDVNEDLAITPSDALHVINYLNSAARQEVAEGEEGDLPWAASSGEERSEDILEVMRNGVLEEFPVDVLSPTAQAARPSLPGEELQPIARQQEEDDLDELLDDIASDVNRAWDEY